MDYSDKQALGLIPFYSKGDTSKYLSAENER